MDIEQFTPDHAGYEKLCRHIMSELHKDNPKSKLYDTPSNSWSYQQLDLYNGARVSFTKWGYENSKKPFYIALSLSATEGEEDSILQCDMTNINFDNDRFTWYLKSPKNDVSNKFFRKLLGNIVDIDTAHVNRVVEVKRPLNTGKAKTLKMHKGHKFIAQGTVSDLTTGFSRLVKTLFDHHAITTPTSVTSEVENDDMDKLTLALSRVRNNQGPFKAGLMKRYNGKCVVTDCAVEPLVIGAHIQDHSFSGVNSLDNGLLLRTDIHTLYDAGLLRIEFNEAPPLNSLLIKLSDEVKSDPYYEDLHNKVIKFNDPSLMPNKEYLDWKTSKYKD